MVLFYLDKCLTWYGLVSNSYFIKMDLVLEKKLLCVASETFEENIYIKNGFLYSMLFFS